MFKLAKFRFLASCITRSSCRSKCVTVLGIETSCDDTGVAIVNSKGEILGESLYSQGKIHVVHGGVLPNFAMDLHKKNIAPAVSETLNQSGMSMQDIDAVAVTVKPGIGFCLQVGLDYAKFLCSAHGKPLIPVHHMKAHALTVRLTENVKFPYLVLLISGGHCILALCESVSEFKVLGNAVSLSPGQILDKVSRALKLKNMEGYTFLQGGLAIERAAEKGNPLALKFQMYKRKCTTNFHLQPLFYAVTSYIQRKETESDLEGDELLPNVHDICASFQYCLIKYIARCLEIGINYVEQKEMIDPEDKTLVVSGGVASNNFFRKVLQIVCNNYGYKLVVPEKKLCTDNGVMIAWNGVEHFRINLPIVKPEDLEKVTADGSCPLGKDLSEDIENYTKGIKYLNLDALV